MGSLVAALLVVACQGSLLTPRDGGEGAAEKRDFWGRPLDDEEGQDGPLPPSFEPIVLPRPAPGSARAGRGGEETLPPERDRVELDAAEQGWREKLQLARSLMDSGQAAAAASLLDAALSASPPAPYGTRLRDLRSELRLRQGEETWLRVDVRPTKDVVTFGHDLVFRVRLTNVGARELRFEAPAGSAPGRPGDPDGSASAFQLEVLRRDRDVYASRLERSWTQTVFLQQAGDPTLVLQPEEWRDLSVRIPTEDVGESILGVRLVELSGVLRPAGLTAGGEPIAGPFRVRRGRALVLPEGFEPLAADPLGGLEQAVALGAAAHILVATEFVARVDAPQAVAWLARALTEGDALCVRAAQGALAALRERCVGDPLAPLLDLLLAALDARPERAPELIGGLSMLTDVRLPPDARLWQDWWRRTREQQPVVRPSDEGEARAPASAEPR